MLWDLVGPEAQILIMCVSVCQENPTHGFPCYVSTHIIPLGMVLVSLLIGMTEKLNSLAML
jgi:hypothetical protein